MFYDETQRNLCVQTLLGLFGAAGWWDETGPKSYGLTLLSLGDDVPLNSSAKHIWLLAAGLFNNVTTTNVWWAFSTLDFENRRVISELLSTFTHENTSEHVEKWLQKYSHYRTCKYRRPNDQ